MHKYYPLFIFTPLIILLDYLTKLWILHRLQVGETLTVLPHYFDLVHVKNRGAAFGMFSEWNSDGRQWFFLAIMIFAMTALGWLYAKTSPNERKVQIALAVIMGGALGNFVD